MIALLLGAQAFVRPPTVGVMAPAVAAKSLQTLRTAPQPQMADLGTLASRIELLQFQMQAQWFMIPIGYFIATRWMDNVNMRYDRIWGPYGDDDRGGMFGGRLGGRGRRDYGRGYDRGYYEPYDRYGYEPYDRGFRSAPEIFSAGLDNFIRDPSGWLSPRHDRYLPDRSTYNRYSNYGGGGYGQSRMSAGRYYADRNSDRSFNSRSRYSSGRYLGRGGYSRGSRYDDYEYGGRIIPTDSVSAMGESARERRDRWLNGPPPV